MNKDFDDILNTKSNYELKINNKLIGVFSFAKAKEKALELIHNHITNEDQAYQYELPFSAGASMNYMYDERLASDEEIIIFERISMLLQDLLYNPDNKQINYINKDYECHNKNDVVDYDFYITNKNNQIIIELNSDNDFLYTNMFNMTAGLDYYFSSRQEIVIKDDSSKRELGEIVELDVLLSKVDK